MSLLILYLKYKLKSYSCVVLRNLVDSKICNGSYRAYYKIIFLHNSNLWNYSFASEIIQFISVGEVVKVAIGRFCAGFTYALHSEVNEVILLFQIVCISLSMCALLQRLLYRLIKFRIRQLLSVSDCVTRIAAKLLIICHDTNCVR